MTYTNKQNSNSATTRFTIDFFNKKIVGTKASFDKAGKGISPIYEELTAKMNAHPDFELVVKEQKHKSNKKKATYDGMDFAFIEEYISIQKNAKQIMADYEAVKAFAKEQKWSVYPHIKKWFLGEFNADGKGFDMEKAKTEVSDARIANAILNGETTTIAEVA